MKLTDYINPIFLFFIFLFGCNANEKAPNENSKSSFNSVIIDVTKLKETNSLRLSQFADSISYLYLSETDYEFSNIFSKIMVDNDTLYLSTSNNVYKYTPEGVFIKKIIDEKQIKISNIKYHYTTFNKKERYFSFSSSTTIVKQSTTYRQSKDYVNFSFDGVYLNETNYLIDNSYKKIESYFGDFCLYKKDTIIVIDSQGNRLEPVNTPINRLGPFLFYAEKTYSNDIFYAYPNPAAGDRYVFHGRTNAFWDKVLFVPVDSTLWFKIFAIDTIYNTQDFISFEPKFIFKTDTSFIDIHQYTQFRNGIETEKLLKKNKITGFLPLQSKDELLYILNGSIAIADKSGRTYGFSSKPIINDLDGYIQDIDIKTHLNESQFYIENNYLYLIIASKQFFKEGCKPPFENMKNDNSPVVLKIKLKT